MNYKWALAAIVITSFLLHCGIIAFLDLNEYNLYDTDTWYSIHQIQMLSAGKPIGYDIYINPPDGREVNWGIVIPYIGYGMTLGLKLTPLQIFNVVGFLAPITSCVFIIIVYLMISKIFNKKIALIASSLMSVGTLGFFINSTFGIIDHHLFESFFVTVGILSLVLYFKENDWRYGVASVGACLALFFTSPSWPITIGLVASVAIFEFIYFEYRTNRHSILLFVIPFSAFLVYIAFQHSFTQYWMSLISWSEPIREIYPYSPPTIILQYLIPLSVVTLGTLKSSNTSSRIIVPTIIAFIITMRFQRFDVILFPLLCVLVAIYLQEVTRDANIQKWVIGAFLLCCIAVNAVAMANLVDTINTNAETSDVIVELSNYQAGVTLAQWDLGWWILVIGNHTPLSDAFQDNLNLNTRILQSEPSNAMQLIRENNISYVIVRKDDSQFWDSMKYYNNPVIDYNASFLASLIQQIPNNKNVQMYKYA